MYPRPGIASVFVGGLLLASGCGIDVAASGAERDASLGAAECEAGSGAAGCVEPVVQGKPAEKPGSSSSRPADAGAARVDAATPIESGSMPADAGEIMPVPATDAGSPQATEDAASAEDSSVGEPEPDDAGAPPVVVPEEPDASVSVPPAQGCTPWSCRAGSYCDDVGGQVRCIPNPSCESTHCGPFSHCELVQVQCFRAPCPPLPMCVSDEGADPCAVQRCGPNMHCVTFPSCNGMRCLPQAQCVPNAPPGTCGTSSCGPGTYCCNASCGTCAPRGAACTQQVCGPFR